MPPNALMIFASAAFLGAVAFSKPVADTAFDDISADRLSAAEISALVGGASGLPPNCEAFYFPDPVTGELVCNAVVCTAPGGFKEIFDCSEFGL